MSAQVSPPAPAPDTGRKALTPCPTCGIGLAGGFDPELIYVLGDRSLRELAEALKSLRGASLTTLRRKCCRLGWVQKRREYRAAVMARALDRLASRAGAGLTAGVGSKGIDRAGETPGSVR